MEYLRDCMNHLREEMQRGTATAVMNVAEVRLPDSYNFYHDPMPSETRLVYDPMLRLMIKIQRVIAEWESPILNDALFLCNYLITECRPRVTPVMKVLTGLELILNKLEEWEIYASKSINSCEAEMLLIK
jgi:midasin (ATPase involved in ribosome maturation)